MKIIKDKNIGKYYSIKYPNSKYKLDELIKAATEELQKGKTYHLSQEMCGFYLNDTSCFF